MIYKVLILLFVVIWPKTNNEMKDLERPRVSMNVDIKELSYLPVEDCKLVQLELTFYSTDSVSLSLDDWAFCVDCDNKEEFSILDNASPELDSILNQLKHSQVVIESANKKLRFFSNQNQLGSKLRPIFSGHPKPDYLRYQKIEINDSAKHYVLAIKSDLKNFENDSVIKLHYLNKPRAEQIVDGEEEIVISSNWLKIN